MMGLGSDGLIYLRGVQHHVSVTGVQHNLCEYLNGDKECDGILSNGILVGYSCSWDDNVRIEYAGYYVDGELIDLEYSLYDSGTIEKAGNYKDGKQDGKWIWWYENGQKQAEGNFIDGKSDGKWIWWNKNGQIKSEIIYNENGIFINKEKFESIFEGIRIAEELLNKKLTIIPPETALQKAQNFLSEIKVFVERNPDEFDIFEIAMFTMNTKLISEGVADDEQLNTVEAFREFVKTSNAFKEFEEKQQDARNQVELEKIDIVMNNIDKELKNFMNWTVFHQTNASEPFGLKVAIAKEDLTSASLVSIDEKIKSLQYILNNPKSLAELENADKELTIFLDDLVAEAQRIADAKKADEELLNKVNTELSIIDQHINKLKTYVRENLSTLVNAGHGPLWY